MALLFWQIAPLNKLHHFEQDEELFDAALDALSSIVSHPDTHNYPLMSKDLLKRILTLHPILVQLMNEGSFDIATPLASLFVTFGEVSSIFLPFSGLCLLL